MVSVVMFLLNQRYYSLGLYSKNRMLSIYFVWLKACLLSIMDKGTLKKPGEKDQQKQINNQMMEPGGLIGII